MEIRDRPCLVKTRDRPLSRRGEKHWVNLREKVACRCNGGYAVLQQLPSDRCFYSIR